MKTLALINTKGGLERPSNMQQLPW